MAKIVTQQIEVNKLLNLGWIQDSESADKVVFVRRDRRGEDVAMISVDRFGNVLSAVNVATDANGEFILYRRINRVKHGKVVTF